MTCVPAEILEVAFHFSLPWLLTIIQNEVDITACRQTRAPRCQYEQEINRCSTPREFVLPLLHGITYPILTDSLCGPLYPPKKQEQVSCCLCYLLYSFVSTITHTAANINFIKSKAAYALPWSFCEIQGKLKTHGIENKAIHILPPAAQTAFPSSFYTLSLRLSRLQNEDCCHSLISSEFAHEVSSLEGRSLQVLLQNPTHSPNLSSDDFISEISSLMITSNHKYC